MKNYQLNVRLSSYSGTQHTMIFKKKGDSKEIKYNIINGEDYVSKVIDILKIQDHSLHARRRDFERMDIAEDNEYLYVNLHYKKGLTNLQEHEMYMFKKELSLWWQDTL